MFLVKCCCGNLRSAAEVGCGEHNSFTCAGFGVEVWPTLATG